MDLDCTPLGLLVLTVASVLIADWDESVGGTYEGVEPMGLLWSLRPVPGSRTGLRWVLPPPGVRTTEWECGAPWLKHWPPPTGCERSMWLLQWWSASRCTKATSARGLGSGWLWRVPSLSVGTWAPVFAGWKSERVRLAGPSSCLKVTQSAAARPIGRSEARLTWVNMSSFPRSWALCRCAGHVGRGRGAGGVPCCPPGVAWICHHGTGIPSCRRVQNHWYRVWLFWCNCLPLLPLCPPVHVHAVSYAPLWAVGYRDIQHTPGGRDLSTQFHLHAVTNRCHYGVMSRGKAPDTPLGNIYFVPPN